MLKNQEINGIYLVGSRVTVLDTRSEYVNREGTVERYGAAGELIYYIVKIDGVQTPITFIASQLKAN